MGQESLLFGNVSFRGLGVGLGTVGEGHLEESFPVHGTSWIIIRSWDRPPN